MNDTIPNEERVLDWGPNHDPKNLDHPVRAAIRGEVPIVPRLWHAGPVLDQGREGACVGFGWTGELLARPRTQVGVTTERANEYAITVYRRAQQIDEWAGENYEGTSVLAGAKAIEEFAMMQGYRWCFGIRDVRDALITQGPVVLGVNWYESMYETDEHHVVKIDGDWVGGHCLLLTGYEPSEDMYRWRNSWGKSYGDGGNAWISGADLQRLLSEDGEACSPGTRLSVKINN